MTPAHRIAVTVLLATLLLAVPRWLDTQAQGERVDRIHAEVQRLESRNAEVRARNLRMLEEVEAMREDPSLLERRVRDALHWARPDEVLFLFTSEATVGTPPTEVVARREGER